MMPCPFCTPENSRILLANTHALAIPDAYPVTPGHTLIIPRRHIASFFETRPEEQTAMLELLAAARSLLLNPPTSPRNQHPRPRRLQHWHQRRGRRRPDGAAPAHPLDPPLRRRHRRPARRGALGHAEDGAVLETMTRVKTPLTPALSRRGERE